MTGYVLNDGVITLHSEESTPYEKRHVVTGYAIGRAIRNRSLGDSDGALPIVVGHDARDASMHATISLVSGLKLAGMKVHFMGTVTEDIVAFGVGAHHMEAGVYITGGTGPEGHIEVRVKDHDAAPFPAEDTRTLLEACSGFEGLNTTDERTNVLHVEDQYADFLNSIAKDYGEWEKQDREFRIALYGGGSQVHHHLVAAIMRAPLPPNVSLHVRSSAFDTRETSSESRVASLSKWTRHVKGDVGVTFDDDGGGLRVVDQHGDLIHPVHINSIITAACAYRWPEGGTLADHRLVFAVNHFSQSTGIDFAVNEPGAVNLKKGMRSYNAMLASDLEGRCYFRETWWHESATLTALLVLNAVYKHQKGAAHLVRNLRKYLPVQGPDRVSCMPNAVRMLDILEQIIRREWGTRVINTVRAIDRSMVMRSCLKEHDWRISLTPGEGVVTMYAEWLGEEHTRRHMDSVYHSLRFAIEASRKGEAV